MNLRELRVGWRTLVKEPGYSLVVVLGLAVGFAACLLLIGFVRYSWQYDAQVPDADNVYVVKMRYNVDSTAPWFEQAPSLLRKVALAAPGVADVSGIGRWGPMPVRVDGRLTEVDGNPVFAHFSDVMGIRTVEGNAQTALSRPDSIAISEEAALRLFGTTHAVDRTVQIDGKAIRVGAIIANAPANTIMPYQMLFGMQSVLIDDRIRDMLADGRNWAKLIVRMQPGVAPQAAQAAMQQVLDTRPDMQVSPEIRQRLGSRKAMELVLSPLRDAYFDRDIAANPIDKPGARGDRAVVGGLGAIALLVLGLAAINYVNLATVRVLQRQREIGIRKTLGAGAWQIARQFCIESLLVAMIAVTAGLLLARLALPLFSELMDRKLDSIFSLPNLAFAVALAVLLGLVCALYPAWIALRVKPAQVLAGRQNMESMQGMRLRHALTVIQLAGAMGLAGVALAIAWQTHFALGADPGFDASNLLVVDLPQTIKESERARGFMTALSQQPGVTGISISADAVGRFDNVVGVDLKREGNATAFVELKPVSANFFEQYRIKPVAGRLFDPHVDKEDDPVPVVVNAMAARQLGFATPQAAVGQVVTSVMEGSKPQPRQIVGIAPEVRFHSLHDGPKAIAYELWSASSTLSVRVAGSLTDVEAAVGRLWPVYFPDSTLQLHHADEILAASYDSDSRLARLLAIASAVILAIAAFGAYALSARSVQRRAREIVLRKLYGARAGNIGMLVVREIGMLILVAALIGLPAAGVAIDRYLAGYAEHAPVGYWTLLFALALTCVTAFLAAVRHTLVAVRMAPAQALRM